MKDLKIGYLALSKLSWKTPKIEGLAKDTAAALSSMSGCRLVAHEGLIKQNPALKTIEKLKKALE